MLSFVRVFIIPVLFLISGNAYAVPRIDYLSHSELERSGRLRIFGAEFKNTQGNGYVLIDGINAFVTKWTDSMIVAYVPEEARIGEVPVQVFNEGGASNEVVLKVKLRQKNGRVNWRFACDSDYLIHRPTIGPDGTIYVTDIGGHFYAIAPNGGLKWIFNLNGQGAQGPVAVGNDGTIYAIGDPAGPDVWLYAVSQDGTAKWNLQLDYATQGVIAGPNIGPDGNIYVVTDNASEFRGGVICISPNGYIIWTNPGNPNIFEYGQVGAEIVFGPSAKGQEINHLYVAFDLYDENRLYSFTLDGNQVFSVFTGLQSDTFLQPQGQPAVARNGNVYLSSFRGSSTGWVLEAYSPVDGSVLWQYTKWPASGISPPSIATNGIAYIVRSVSRVDAVSEDGSGIWTHYDGTLFFSCDVSPNGKLVIIGGSPDFGVPGFIRGIKDTGDLAWQVNLSTENGGYLATDTRASFSFDNQTAYMGVSILADGSSNEYCYVYSIDCSTRKDVLPVKKPPRF